MDLIAVLGPSNPGRVGAAAGIHVSRYHRAAELAGRSIAALGLGLLVVPDRGVAVAAMDGYLAAGGARLVGMCPSSGESEADALGSIHRERLRCHEVVDDLSWYEQHYRIGAMAHAMVCVGLSSGTIAELVWTKWNPAPPPVALVGGTHTGLPAELDAELRVQHIEEVGIPSWIEGVVRDREFA